MPTITNRLFCQDSGCAKQRANLQILKSTEVYKRTSKIVYPKNERKTYEILIRCILRLGQILGLENGGFKYLDFFKSLNLTLEVLTQIG